MKIWNTIGFLECKMKDLELNMSEDVGIGKLKVDSMDP